MSMTDDCLTRLLLAAVAAVGVGGECAAAVNSNFIASAAVLQDHLWLGVDDSGVSASG